MPRIDRSHRSNAARVAEAASPMAVIRIGGVLPLPDLLRERGIEPGPVIRRAGMIPSIFDDSENVVPYVQMCRLMELASETANCEHFGLLVGARSTMATIGLVGLFAQVHEDVGAALRSIVQYLHLHDRGAGLALTVGKDVACLSYVIGESAPGADVVCDGAVATAFNVIKALAGPAWRPTEVLLPRTPPVDRRPFNEFFKAPVRFEAGIAALVFPAAWLDRPIHTGDAVFRRLLERWVIELDDQQPGQFHTQVARTIRTLVLTGHPTIDAVAAAHGLTGRALRRRLIAEGTCFRKVAERTRFDLARQLLAGSDQPIARIAVTLGYAEPAAFMHAFRRWSGSSPARWRNTARTVPATAVSKRPRAS
jgi:AraC-like DNA-binding protein